MAAEAADGLDDLLEVLGREVGGSKVLDHVVEDEEAVQEKNLVISVGTSLVDPDGEDLASKGRILLFEVRKSKKRKDIHMKNPPLELMLKSEKDMALGPVTSLSSLRSEDIYRVVVGGGAEITVEQWGNGKLTQMGFYHAHMQVQEIKIFKTFFICNKRILFLCKTWVRNRPLPGNFYPKPLILSDSFVC